NITAANAAFPGVFIPTDISLACLGAACGLDAPGVADGYPQGRNVTQWGIVDDLSITRGNHSFKMGVNFRRDDVSDYTASNGLYPVAGINAVDFSNDVLNPAGAGSAGDSLYQAFAQNLRQPI